MYTNINKWISTLKSTKVQMHRLTHAIEHEGVVATEFKSFVVGHDVDPLISQPNSGFEVSTAVSRHLGAIFLPLKKRSISS